MAKSEHDLALKVMKAEGIRAELNNAWVKLDEVDSSAIEAERCIESLRKEVREASSVRSELEGCVFELIEDAKVTSAKTVKEYKRSEVFKDKVTEGTLDMFLFGFDECKKQIGFLHPDLKLGNSEGSFWMIKSLTIFCFLFYVLLWASS